MNPKPNILVILSDQHSQRYSGCYGHPVVQTPNLDRLASRGLRFDNAYCDSPICVPSRSAFMTGRRVSTLEIWDNNTVLPSDETTLGHRLNDAGYEAVLCGRMHFNGDDKTHGFQAQIAEDPDANASIPNWAAGGEVAGHSLTLETLAKRPKVGNGFPRDDLAGERAAEFIRQRSGNARPWAMVVGFMHPHGPWNAEQEYWDLYNEDDIDLPASESPADSHPIHQRNRRLRQMPADGYPGNIVRRNRHAYYAVISRMDEKVGQILDALETSGQADNTIVVYVSDHGEMLGEHGLWMKSSLFEDSIGVPLIMAGPGIPCGVRNENVVLSNLTATVCDLAGADTAGMEGRSFRCLIDGGGKWDNHALIEYYATWTERPLAALRRDQYKLIASLDEPPQLFDLEEDPKEKSDLTGNPEFAMVLQRLQTELATHWNPQALHAKVLDSQNQRQQAQQKGRA